MKKYILTATVIIFCIACNNQTDKGPPADTTTTGKKSAPVDNPDYDAGLDLVAKSDCFSCHKLNEASIGPAYGEIAKKYENNPANVTLLATKVIAGGQGVWGQVPMAAHPAIAKEDAEKMVKYILLLKE
ncbi:MAG: c-type cytochrome [Ferruginibacter sp.]